MTSSVWLRHFVPALSGGVCLYAALSQLERDLSACDSAAEAVAALAVAKEGLFSRLRARCPEAVARALVLKLMNVLLARYHLRARSSVLASRPFGLVVDPSNVCQLACPGCVHSESVEAQKLVAWPRGTLSGDRYAALLATYGPHALGACLYNYGEPLLNLRTPELIRQAKRYLLWTALSTSLAVRRFDAEAYVVSGLDFAVVSIDGVTQSVYERFRRKGDLAQVLANLRLLVEAKRRLGRSTPVVSWNFLAFAHNAHEIAAAMRMAREMGVNEFRVVNPFDVRWDDPEMRPAAVKGGVWRLDWTGLAHSPLNAEEADAEAISRAYENPWPGPVPDEAPVRAGHSCHWLYKNMVMDATGRVLPCCGAPPRDGSLTFGQFDGTVDPFNAERYQQARTFFATGAAPGDAPHCTRCEWDQTVVNVGSAAIRRYFRSADPVLFDRRSLRLLSDW